MSIIDELKAKVDLAEVAGCYTRLLPAGKSLLKGLCPLHQESNPSFFVYCDTQHWHCYGCNKGGDVLDLVQAMEHWDFATTLQTLAQRTGVILPAPDPKGQAAWERKRQVSSILETAMAYFEKQMDVPQSPGMHYAKTRGWSRESIHAARLGYYDGNRKALRSFLQDAGTNLDTPISTALLRTPGPSLVYPFVQRGAVVYYAVRLLHPANGQAKAWNPPSDLAGPKPLYHNFCYTPTADTLMLVEGQGDAVTLGQWHMAAVATVGTGIHETLAQHLEHHSTIYIGVERDAAGEQHARDLASRLHPTVRLVRWPKDDANAWLQDGGTQRDLESLLAKSPTWLDVLIKDATTGMQPSDDQLRSVFQAYNRLDSFQQARQRDPIKRRLHLNDPTFNALLKTSKGDDEKETMEGGTNLLVGGCLCHRAINAEGQEKLVQLCNFQARITHDVLVDDGLQQTRTFRISGRTKEGHPLPEVEIPAGTFERMDWLLNAWGAQVIVNSGYSVRDRLRYAIQKNSNDIQQTRAFAHLGWCELAGQRHFLSHASVLQSAWGDGAVQVVLPLELRAYQLPEQESAREKTAAEASMRFWDVGDLAATLPLWAAMYLAPLNPFLHPAFSLWLYGTTGCMKSTLTALALCHYGQFTYDTPTTSWSSTAFALRRLAFVAKDVPLWIDDYTPQLTAQGHHAQQQKAEVLLRDWGNRAIRSRGQANGKLSEANPPRCLVVSTAELLPPNVSIRARLFTLEMHPGMVTSGRDSALTRAQKSEASLYPLAMAGYVHWIADQWQATADAAASLLEARLADARDHLDGHPRSAMNTAMLGVGLEMGLRYLKTAGILTEDDYTGRLSAGWDILLGLGNAQDKETNAEVDSLEMYFTALENVLTQGTGHLRSLEHPEAETLVQPQLRAANSVLLGWYDADHWYLLPQIAYQVVYQFYRASGILFPDTERGVLTKLREKNYIVKSNHQRATLQLRIQQQRQRLIVVPAHGEKENSNVVTNDIG